MDIPGKLTLEQEFTLQNLARQCKLMSAVQAQEYVVEVTRQILIKDNLIKHLLKGDPVNTDSVLMGGRIDCGGDPEV
jgi:hypothetical protein